MMKKFLFLMVLSCLCLGIRPQAAQEDPDWAFDEMDMSSMQADGPMMIAEEAPDVQPRADGMYYVTDFGANGADTADDADAFVNALNKGMGSAVPVTVYVPAGTYYIGRGLPIYSDTTLILDKSATIVAMHFSGSLLYGRHLDEQGNICGHEACTHGGYSQIHNVTIQGGVWDRNCTSDISTGVLIKIRHGSNVTIRDMVCKNATGHYINVSGVDTVLIENVQFLDAVSYTGAADPNADDDPSRNDSKEAIHMDYTGLGGGESTAYPKDGTAIKNATVQNCLFQDVFAGVGTHHRTQKNRGDAVTIRNNTFRNIQASCVNAYDFDHLLVSGNTAENVGRLVYSAGSSGTIEKNSVKGATKNAIYVRVNPSVTVSGNTVLNTAKRGIYALNCQQCTITGNTVRDSVGDGIYVVGNSSAQTNAVIQGNISASTSGANRDIRLGANCKNCVIENNRIGTRGLKVETSYACQISNNQFDLHTHVVLSWSQTKAPTVLAVGTRSGTCDICGQIMTQDIAKVPPTIKVSAASIPLKVKQSYQASVSNLARGDKVVSWSSSNKKVATVNNKGKITGKKTGKTTIKITLKSGLTKNIAVKVQKKEVKTTGIALNYSRYTLGKGKKFTLKATVSPVTSRQKVTYTSSNAKIVKVSKKGVVKGLKKGTATVKVKSGSKTVKCKITVL